MATTREYFDIDGEVAIRLSPLDAAEADGPAVELFVDRALAGGSSQDSDDDDLATIASLCSHLDGSPLAIELAAGRCGVFTPTELLDAIGERFELLRGGRRRRSRQALEDTLNWSYELLDDDEQRVFRKLAVFSGSFDRVAVAAVAELSAAGAIDLLESLTAKSSVQTEQSAESTRFRLLETPSAYAERAAHLMRDPNRSRAWKIADFDGNRTGSPPGSDHARREHPRHQPHRHQIRQPPRRLRLHSTRHPPKLHPRSTN